MAIVKSCVKAPISSPVIGGGWTPTSEASLYHWIDVSDETTITHSSSLVSALANKAAGPNYTQVSGSSQPIYDAGNQSINFDGSSDFMIGSGPLAITTARHLVFMVISDVVNDTGQTYLWNNSNASGARNFIAVLAGVNQIGYMNLGTFFTPTGTAFSASTTLLATGRYNGLANSYSNVNGGPETDSGNGGDFTAANHTLGGRVTTNNNAEFKLHEWFIFSGHDSADEAAIISNAEAYVASKWGISLT